MPNRHVSKLILALAGTNYSCTNSQLVTRCVKLKGQLVTCDE